MPDFLSVARFPLPDEWEPDGTRCVIVRIPDDPQYLATLTGLIDLLTWSNNFARDETTTGAAIVCRTWQTALEVQPIIWAGCDMPDTRINPETCLYEVNCGTDEVPDWKPIFTPDYDPGADAPHENLYPDGVAEGQSVPCISAANTVAMLTNGATNFSNLLDLDSILGAVVAFLYTFLSSVVTVTLSQLWLGLGVQYGAFDAVTFASDLAAFDWDDLLCLLNEAYELDGTMSGASWASVLDTMQDRSAEPNQIWLFLAMVWGLMGRSGAEFATRWGNITEAECDECVWCHTFDFTTGDHGWLAVDEDLGHGTLPSSTYVGGSGWSANAANVPDRIRIKLDLPSGTFLNKFTGHFSTAMTGDARWSQLFSGGGLWMQIVPEDDTTSVFEFSPVEYASPINWVLDNDSGDASFIFYITSIELCGTGDEPEWT